MQNAPYLYTYKWQAPPGDKQRALYLGIVQDFGPHIWGQMWYLNHKKYYVTKATSPINLESKVSYVVWSIWCNLRSLAISLNLKPFDESDVSGDTY